MGNSIKAIIKEPGESWGHITNIDDSLENLQRIVYGNIETIHVPNGAVLVFSEEGKIRGYQHNFNVTYHHYINPTDYIEEQLPIVGTVIVLGTKGTEFADIPINTGTWKHMLRKWGNQI